MFNPTNLIPDMWRNSSWTVRRRAVSVAIFQTLAQGLGTQVHVILLAKVPSFPLLLSRLPDRYHLSNFKRPELSRKTTTASSAYRLTDIRCCLASHKTRCGALTDHRQPLLSIINDSSYVILDAGGLEAASIEHNKARQLAAA